MKTRAELLQVSRIRRQKRTQFHRRCALVLIVLLLIIGTIFALNKPLIPQFLSPDYESSKAWGDDTSQLASAKRGDSSTNAVHPEIPIPVLINKATPLSQKAADPKLASLVGIVPVIDNTMCVDELLVDPLISLFAAAEQNGLSDFYVNSAFRTEREQEALYRDAEDKSYVQRPGHSEHQIGLAIDLAVDDFHGEEMEDSDVWQWLDKHAWEYGFILRYPSDKVNITGIAYEPWHFRYVGTKIAKYCYSHNLCLEEYVSKANGS